MIIPALTILPLLTSQEQWLRQSARTGDHIRVSRGVYTHHGVYVSHNEVIHFASEDNDNLMGDGNEVIATSLSRFLLDGDMEVRIYNDDELNDLYPVADIVRWARGSRGDSGYHLVFNNCEHFANWCTLGRFHSQQVNNVLGVMNMGVLDWGRGVLSAVFGGSNSGGSRSRSSESSTYNYDPDKVRVAEIEADTAKEIAYQENQRIGLIKDAQMELMEFSARMEAAVIEAKVRGFEVLQQNLLVMTKALTQIAHERLVLLEQGHLGVVAQIDSHYQQLEIVIHQDNDLYHFEKLPKLLGMLEKFPEGTPGHKLYFKALDQDMAKHVQFQTMQFQGVQHRLSK
jgi:diadenosine tetraphosphatase ApaH/serine/threonine PP2A family protein phosphatase